MRIVCIDDEKIALKNILLTLDEIEGIEEKKGFSDPEECLEFISSNEVDIVFMDIRMRDVNGLELAKQIKEIDGGINIIFLTGYSEYAVSAFRQHASGYLMKPASVSDVKAEIDHIKESRTDFPDKSGIQIQTFGNFAVFADGQQVIFSRNKSKEVLAYLVDRRGASVKMSEIASILWDEGGYDRSRQKQMQVYISEMTKSLKAAGAEHIIVKHRTGIALDKNKVKCDYYDFLKGDPDAVNSYFGEYMSNYSWGEMTLGFLDMEKSK